MVLLAAGLVAATACNRTNKAEQLAALDGAYQSGLLTRDEYDAKRRALTAQAPEPATTQAPVPVPSPAPAAAPPPKVIQPPAQPAPALPPPRASTPLPAPPITPPSSPKASAAAAPPEPPIAPSAPPGGDDAKEPAPAPLAGCEDAQYKSGGQKGAEDRFFAAPPEVVRRAAVSALGSLDFNIHKNSSNIIEASKRRHIGVLVGAGGERVILTFQKTERGGQSGTRVVGETKKSFVGRMAQKTWTDAVLAQIDCKLREARR
jgi:hypothetical protein